MGWPLPASIRRNGSFFSWLGVVPYLTEHAIFSTLRLIACVPGGAHVVFDYANPPSLISERARRRTHEALAARVAAAGEAIKSYLETDELHAKLVALGFSEVEDLRPPADRGALLPELGRFRPRRWRSHRACGDRLMRRPPHSARNKGAEAATTTRGRLVRFFRILWPVLVTGAADDDRSGISTFRSQVRRIRDARTARSIGRLAIRQLAAVQLLGVVRCNRPRHKLRSRRSPSLKTFVLMSVAR